MNYLERLSSGDVKTICELIGPRELKQNFRANSNGFNTIKPGFRPNSLSDEMAVSLTAQNVTMRFISKFLNEKIQSMMDKIASEQDKLILQGVPSDGARVVALANSLFSNNMELYFRLEQLVRSSEEIGALKIAVRLVKGMCQNESNSVHASKAADNLEEDALRKELEAQKEYAQKKIQQLQGLLKDVQADVNKKQDNIIQLQGEKKKIEDELNTGKNELEKYRKLEKYSISQKPNPINAQYPYRSLCKVFWTEGYIRLIRLSDIQNDEISGNYVEKCPYTKDILYSDQKAGTFPENYIGVWDWKTIPKDNQPGWIINSIPNESYPVTQVVILKECTSIKQVVKKLVTGVSEKMYCNSILFTYWNGQKYEGVRCRKQDLDIRADRLVLRENVFELPVFEIFPSMLYQAGECQICNVLNFGMTCNVIKVKEPVEILKTLLRNRLTWATSKQKGITKATHQQIVAYLQELPDKDFVQELSEQCNCTEVDAQKLIQEFVQEADAYLSASDVEDETLRQIILRKPELEKRCKELLTKEWAEDNDEKLREAENFLQQKKDEAEKAKTRFDQLNSDYVTLEQKLKESNNELEKREQLAAEVEQRVADRIAKAQKDAADFIASQAFLPQSKNVNNQKVSETAAFVSGETQGENLVVLKTLDDVMEELAYNLRDAGVQEKYAKALAAYLCSAYRHHIPVLLAGPNGLGIVQAFSMTLFGKSAAILSCMGEYSEEVCDVCEESDDEVVAILNPFCVGWTQRLPLFVGAISKFCFLITPYVEDLQVEPLGMLNYLLPLATEFFVDKRPTGMYPPNKLGMDFSELPKQKMRRFNEIFLTKFGSLAKRNLWELFADMEYMLKDDPIKETANRYLFGLLPFACFAGKFDTLLEQLEKDVDKLPKDFYKMLHDYLGEDE